MEKILLKYISGNANPEERKLVVKWLNESNENMEQYEVLRKLYSSMVWQDAGTPVRAQRTLRPYIREIVKIAAVFAIILSLFYAKDYFFPPRGTPLVESITMQEINVPPGQRVEVTLVDGTHVWLNANTKFSFPNIFSGSNREITLDGEARFDVTANKDMPFVVKTAKHDVKVLGTQFNVMAYSGSDIFETALIKGKVEILSPGSPPLVLEPQYRAISRNGKIDTTAIRNYDYYRWTEGLLCFENEPIENLLNKISIYFDVKITINNKYLGKRRYTGKFWVDDGVEHMLKVLQLNNNFSYKRNVETNEIVIN
ncbi:MAG TPA: anti-sigma factor [Dysgonomonas sp.]|nr:anti-sigma factor [Dysgonomonas sp.]